MCILKLSRSYQTTSLSQKLESEHNGLKTVEMVHFTGKHMKLRAPLIELGLSWQAQVPNCYYRRMQTYGYTLICLFSWDNQRNLRPWRKTISGERRAITCKQLPKLKTKDVLTLNIRQSCWWTTNPCFGEQLKTTWTQRKHLFKMTRTFYCL